MKQNYQLITDRIIREEAGGERRPTLLLHACCAPCSSYVLEYLSEYFQITVLFYNPNISPKEEYDFRLTELGRMIEEMGLAREISVQAEPYCPEEFEAIARGLEDAPEGGPRCARCYRLRLQRAARVAAEGGFDYMTTTLSISPYKNAEWLNAIGEEEAERAGVRYLYSDFKKRNGYRRSCQLSAELKLYRQDYCGCVYSKRERDART